jgi:microcystin degradation protein MlrC
MSFKVLTAEVYHETNTFNRHVTDEQSFRDRYFLLGKEAIERRGTANTEIAGFVEVGHKHDWQISHVLSTAAGPSGKVTRSAFDWICDPIISASIAQQFDGILLGLHGAMVTDFCEDGDGEILKRLRQAIGANVPIAITLDPHANLSAQMCDLSNIIVSFKTYPHVDMRESGKQAAEILHRTMLGEISPRTIRVDCPMLEEVNGGRTDTGPMIARLERAANYESRPDVFAVSINAGFAGADIFAVGPTVSVTAIGDMDSHLKFADSIAEDIWTKRHDVLNTYLDVDAAAALAKSFDATNGPLVIADYADNPGAGAYGDSTNLLHALLAASVENCSFGPIVDGQAARTLSAKEVGEVVLIELGGKMDPRFGGGPLQVEGEILVISDGHFVGDGPIMGGLRGAFGPTVVLRVADIDILIVTIAQQILDLQQFKSFGIDPSLRRVVALKSMQHFRAAFEPIAGKVIVCDSGALATLQYDRLPYANVRRPLFPLDKNVQRLGHSPDVHAAANLPFKWR